MSLLRVLQEGRYRCIGSSEERCANVRVLAASNTPLDELVQAGAFRTDLYYRLCVFRIHLPSLRQRPEDIPLLADHFLKKHVREEEPTPELSPEALTALVAYDWPGNVREVENTIIRASRLCRNGRIEKGDLGLPTSQPAACGSLSPFQTMKQAAVRNFERDYPRRLMTACQGNVTRAAKAAGNDRRELGKLLKKHQIDPRATWRRLPWDKPAASRGCSARFWRRYW